MLLNDIISLFRETARGAHVVDNERIDDRIWQDYAMLNRNQFIKNYINEKGTIEQNTLQYEILDVEVYDSASSIAGISIGKKILRTEECPTLIEGRSGVAVFELSAPDLESRTIQPVSMDRLRWCGNGVANRDSIFAAFYDGRFYIKSGAGISEKPITKIRVVGAFADPTQVSTYTRATDDYPVNDYMIRYMLTAIMEKDFKIIGGMPSDETNDASGEVDGTKGANGAKVQ
jgi:hypothetical protein